MSESTELAPFRDLRAAGDVMRLFTQGAGGMFPGIQSAEQLAVICGYGAALGLNPMAAPFQIHIMHGRPTLSAGAIMGLVLQSPVCDYFECEETSSERATFVTKRKGGKGEQRLTFTVADAKRAGLLSNKMWQKYPAEMLRARAGTALARMAYPDVLQGAYASEEFEGAGPAEPPRVLNPERVSSTPAAVAAPDPVVDAEFTEPDPLEGLSALMEAMGEERWAAAQADWKRADVGGDKPPAAQLAWLQQWHDAQQA